MIRVKSSVAKTKLGPERIKNSDTFREDWSGVSLDRRRKLMEQLRESRGSAGHLHLTTALADGPSGHHLTTQTVVVWELGKSSSHPH